VVVDRHCPASGRPLLTGTRFDRTSARADRELISRAIPKINPDFADGEPRRRLPAGLSDHVTLLFADQQRVFDALVDACTNRPEVFDDPIRGDSHESADEVGQPPLYHDRLTPRRLANVMSPWALMPEQPYGPPTNTTPRRRSAGILLPGRDRALVRAAEAAQRGGILFAGVPIRDEVTTIRAAKPMSMRELPYTAELGIVRPRRSEYRWVAELGMLARTTVGKGSHTELWRLAGIGTDERLRLAAVAMIDHHLSTQLRDECLDRWERDAGPGMMKAYTDEGRAMSLDLLDIASASLVEAVRRAQVRRDFG
jgi:hypothetical protein